MRNQQDMPAASSRSAQNQARTDELGDTNQTQARSPDVLNRMADEMVRQLRELQEKYGDPEFAHSEADSILCDLLIALGYDRVVQEWAKVPKWYA